MRNDSLYRRMDNTILNDGDDSKGGDAHIAIQAQNILGLTNVEAHELFTPDGISWDGITTELAVAVIRNFASTGKVQWNKFNKTGKEV